jgi:hypothetical protein
MCWQEAKECARTALDDWLPGSENPDGFFHLALNY